MKRAGIISILLLAYLLPFSLQSFAGERAGAFSISPFAGGYSFDGIQHFETEPVYGLRLGYDVTNNWETELMFDFVTTNSTQTRQGFNIFSYRLDVLYNFMPEHTFVPYIAIGGGGSYKEPKNDPEFNDVTFNIGGGLKYFITDSIALRGDVRQLFIFGGETLYDWEYTVGLSFLFGGVKPIPSRAQPHPVATPASEVTSASTPEASLEPVPATKPATEVTPTSTPKAPLEPVPVTEQKSVTKKQIALNILFYIDTAHILDKSHNEIGKLAAIMRESPSATVVFDGHNAKLGRSHYNIFLSQRRVESVVNYLVEKFGIERSRLTVKGYGEPRPAPTRLVPRGGGSNKKSVNVIFDCVIR